MSDSDRQNDNRDIQTPETVGGAVSESGTVYLFAAGIAAQVGCLLTVITGGAVVGGLVLDQALNTKPIFLFILLLASIPLNLMMIYRFTLYQARRAQASQQPVTRKRGKIGGVGDTDDET
ncbi:MAG: AtpZ/AtpI family protein [Burkholderiales bacterium]|nr:AtpZ/AtpI family protein [Anaerolineae bacterium]